MRETPLLAVRRLTRAWIRKDGPQMSRWLTDDVTEIGPAFTAVLAGKKDFFLKYQAYFDGELQVEDYRILRPRTVRLSARLALVYFHYAMTTRTGDVVRHSHGKESLVAEKTREGWKVKSLHWHEDPQL